MITETQIEDFLFSNLLWADTVFHSATSVTCLKHLQKEAGEAIEALEQNASTAAIAEELGDCFLLLMQAANRQGFRFRDIFNVAQAKMIVNKEKMQWGEPNAEGFTEHIKEESFVERFNRRARELGSGARVSGTDRDPAFYVCVDSYLRRVGDHFETKEVLRPIPSTNFFQMIAATDLMRIYIGSADVKNL